MLTSKSLILNIGGKQHSFKTLADKNAWLLTWKNNLTSNRCSEEKRIADAQSWKVQKNLVLSMQKDSRDLFTGAKATCVKKTNAEEALKTAKKDLQEDMKNVQVLK